MSKKNKTSIDDFLALTTDSDITDSSSMWRPHSALKNSQKEKLPFLKRQPLDSKKTAISDQLDSKRVKSKTAERQPLDSGTTETESSLDSHCTADSTAGKTAYRQQLDSKKTASGDILSLTGKEDQLVKIVFQNCQNSGSLETSNLSTEHLRKSLEITTKRLGNLVERLLKKQIFIITFSKRGNGGFRRFKLYPEHYQKLTLEQKDSISTAIRQQKDSHCTADSTADKTAEASSSSSNTNLNKKTTTTELPEEWLSIQTPQNLKDLGLGASQIKQLYKSESLTAEDIKSSLVAFSYDLDNGKVNARTGALNLLMGVLLKKGVYVSESYLIESRKEIDSYLLKIEELESAKEKLKDINEQKQFEDWLESLSEGEKNKIVIPNNLIKSGSSFQLTMLKAYWDKEVKI
jgi:hypothetical protein